MGMITEKPSKELTEVYASSGISSSPKGVENHSPDETHSTSTSSSGQESKDGGRGLNNPQVKEDIKGMSGQEKGEKVGSGDTTHTPDSMVYEPITNSSTTTTPEGEAPLPKSGGVGVRHRSLLLSPSQIPLLKETFDLRPSEVLDITRAVEQADLRAKAIDRRNGAGGGQK
jgi:hypothetical protein